MPEIDAKIPLSYQQPDAFKTLGSLMDVAKGAQSLQRGGIALEQERGQLEARKRVAEVIQNADFRDPETGLFDLNRAAPAMLQADPKNYIAGDMIKNLAGANNDLITVKKATLGLADTSRAMLGAAVGAMANDPGISKGKVGSVLDQLEQQAPDTKPIIGVWRKHLGGLADDPKALREAVMMARSQVMPPTAQIESQTPGGLPFNTGQVSGVINTKPTAGETGVVPGTMTQNVVPPTGAEQVGTDALGNPVRVVRDARGVITLEPMNTRGGSAPQGASTPMFSFPPGESPKTKEALEGERQTALQALSQAPVMRETNRGILREIDQVIATGKAGPFIQGLASRAGVAFETAEQKSAAYDVLGKYLERNAIAAAQGMGPHTNAGLEAQIKANGSVEYSPTALKKITKLNDALVSGVEAYQPGLEKAITGSPNQIFAKRQFDQAWAQNFDPRIMMLSNAVKAGDRREIEDLTRGMSAAEKAELARKAKAIEALSTKGSL